MGNMKVPYRGRFVVLKKLIAIDTSICNTKVFVQCDREPNPARAVYILVCYTAVFRVVTQPH